MTVTAKKTHTTHCVTRVHSIVLGNTRMYCIIPNCDGKHHVWCNCGSSH